MKEQFFFVDAETDGLYGKFLSVAALVVDKNGKEIDRFYGAVKIKAEDIKTDWVKENVLPYLNCASVIYDDETAMLESFWIFWLRYRENAECVAYVPYPVESRLFTVCVMNDCEERQFLGPFPLYDLATLMESKSIYFDSDMKTLSGMSLSSHDAMNDVIMMSEVWKKLFK